MKYLIYFLLVNVLISCSSTEKEIDTSMIKIDFKSQNFHRDFNSIDPQKVADGLTKLEVKYPDFLNFYLDTLMSLGKLPANDSLQKNITMFLTYKDYKFLSDTIDIAYASTKKQDEELHSLFKRIKYYFPQWKTPNVVYFNGGLKLWSAVTYKDMLCIGLDMFLGENFQYYPSRQIPEYMMKIFNPIQIPVQAAKVIYNDLRPLDNLDLDFLGLMIESGKKFYYLEKVLPQIPFYEYYGITKTQYKWMEDNEANIFNYFIQHELLYSTVYKDIIKYIQEAPTSSGMPAESPGQTGSYIGYKMIKIFMEKNPTVTLEQLIQESNYDNIYKMSNYKPH